MSVYSDVLKKIAPFMKSKGFLRSGYSGRFYYVANDIAYCITFEKPSSLIYVSAYIMPLYIPTEFVYLTYGERLRNLKDLQLPLITENNPEYIEQWCTLFSRSMEDKIIPIFKQIDSPETLIRELERESPPVMWLLHCPLVWIEKLKMYTYLYLQRLPQTEAAIESYRKEILCNNFTEGGIQLFLEEANVVELLLHEAKEKRYAFIADTIEHTKTFYKEAFK